MDEIMDTKVVQMKFDNSQFRVGVQDTIKQLERLENSLELDGASNGLNQVAKASKETTKSMNEFGSAVDQVQRHFTALEVAGITVMMRLTNAAINYGKKITAALWSPIIEGGKRRSQNISNAKFQLEGLGVAWDDISADINYGVKDTAYGLDEAAKAAAQMVASMDLSNGYTKQMSEEMKVNLRAISGVAAMTNSSYTEIADVFTTVSSNGKLMTMQLRQLAARGLNASAVLAKALHTTEEEVNSMVSKGQISFRQFADAMDEAFGEHAKEANKTFQGAMSNIKAALGRIGAKFADPVYEALRRIFNGFIPVVDNINKALEPIVTAFSKITEIGGTWLAEFLKVEDTSRFFMQLAINLYSYMRPMIIAFVETFAKYVPLVDRGTRSMSEFAEQFVLVGDKAEKFKDICRAVFSILDLLIHVGISGFKIISSVLKGILGIVDKIRRRSITFFSNRGLNLTAVHLWQIVNALTALVDMATKFVQTKIESAFDKLATVLASLNWPKILNVISKIVIVVSVAWQLLVKLVNLAVDGFIRLLPILEAATSTLVSFVTTTAYALALVGTLLAGIFGKGKSFLYGIGQSIRGFTSGTELDTVTESISDIGQESSTVTESANEASDALEDMSDRVEVVGKNARIASKDIRNLREVADELAADQKGISTDRDKQDGSLFGGFPNNKSDELFKGIQDNQRKMGFFETLVSYFMDDQDSAIAMAAKKIDDFFNTVGRYLHDVSGEFIYNLQGILGVSTIPEMIQAIIAKAFKWGTILTIARVWFSVYNTIVAIFDLIPAIARLINSTAIFIATYNISKILSSTLAFFIGLSAFLLTLTFILKHMEVEELEKALTVIENFLANLIKRVLYFALAFQAMIVVAKVLSELPNIIRLITGRELRDSGMTKFLKFMQALSMFLLALSASLYVITYILENFEPESVIAAGIMVAAIVYAVMAFTVVLNAMGYSLAKGADVLSVTRKGITRSVTRFQDYIADIFLSMSLLILSIVGAMYVILRLQESFGTTNVWIAFGVISSIFGALLVFTALIMFFTKVIMPKVDNFLTAEAVMTGAVQAIKAMKGVILSLGLSILMVAAALKIVSTVEVNDLNREAFTFLGVVVAIITVLTILVAVIAGLGKVDFDRKIVTISVMIAAVALAISSLVASSAYIFKVLADLGDKLDPDILNSATLFVVGMTFLMGVIVAIMGLISNLGNLKIGAMVSFMAAFAVVGVTIALIGQTAIAMMKYMSITELDAVTNFLGVMMGVIVAVIAIFSLISMIPGVGEVVMATLLSLSAVFVALGWLFVSIGAASVLVGIGVQKLVEAIDMFSTIRWDDAKDAASSLLQFIISLNFAALSLRPSTLIGIGSLGVVSYLLSKALNAMSGINTRDAIKAARAIGEFISTMNEYFWQLQQFKLMAETFTMIAWIIAAGVAAFVVITVEALIAAANLTVFAFIINHAGEDIKTAMMTFLDIIHDMSDRVLTDLPTLAGGMGWLAIIAALLVVGSAGLLVGSALLLAASGTMTAASLVMVDSFDAFATALVAIGEKANAFLPIVQLLLPNIIKFGLTSIAIGGMLLVAAGLFCGAGVLFAIGSIAIGFGLFQTMEFCNEFLVELTEFVDNLEALVERLGEAFADPSWYSAGGLGMLVNTVDGIENGSEEERDRAINVGRNLGMALLFGFTSILEIESPSKVMFRNAGYIVDGLVNGTEANSSRAKAAGTELSKEYLKGFDTDAIAKSGETAAIQQGKSYEYGLKAVSPEVGRESNQFAQQQAEEIQNGSEQGFTAVRHAGSNTATSYGEGIQEAEPTVSSGVRSFVGGIADFFGLDLSGFGNGSVTSWFNGMLSSLGVNVDGIKDKVYGIGEIIGGLLGDGAGNAIDRAMHAIARMLATQLSDVQQQAINAAPAGSTVRMYMEQNTINANEWDWYNKLRNWKDFLPEVPSVDDFLGSVGGGGGGYTPDYTSDLASSISGSSGAGSGINDVSKSSSIGGGVGNTITNSNNTYNFTQNNYSPEALNRSEIYTQTRNQFNTFYGFMRDKNPAF